MCLLQKACWSLWTVAVESLFWQFTIFHLKLHSILSLNLFYCTHISIWCGNKGQYSSESGIHAFFTWSLNLWICYTGRHTTLRSDYHCFFLVYIFVVMLFRLRNLMGKRRVSCIQYINRKMFILSVCEGKILYYTNIVVKYYTNSILPVWHLLYVLMQTLFKKMWLTCFYSSAS